MGKQRKTWGQICAIFVVMFCALYGVAYGDAILNVDSATGQANLEKFRSPVAAERSNISLQGPGDPKAVSLEAKGPGPTYFWSLFSFHNTTSQPLDFVVDIEPQRFPGSGLLPVQVGANIAINAIATNGQELRLDSPLAPKNLSFRIAPNETFNIAIESPSANLNASLWQRQLWLDHQAQLSFFGGLVLGVGLLVCFGLLAMFAFRPHLAFLSAALFAIAAVLFIALQSGHLDFIAPRLAKFAVDSAVISAFVETALAATLALCVLNFIGLGSSSPLLGFAVVFLGGLMIANGLYAFAEPIRAATVARLGFAILAMAGFLITLQRRKKAEPLVDQDLLFWGSLVAWTIFAGFLAEYAVTDSMLSPLLHGSLAAILVVMAMTLMKFLFAQGLSTKPFITDSSRRSLALSSAGHILWEWQPFQNMLSVGDDLPRSLGVDTVSWQANAQNAFIDTLYPQDRVQYLALLESIDVRPGQLVLRELRLRNASGAYRWYLLRARWVKGPGQRLDRCIGTLTDITKGKEAEEQLVSDAVHDPVTELPNRVLFIDRVERELAKTLALPFRVILVDIDRFKILNDALGHDQGDQLLKIAGERIKKCIEPDETVARISGSQFAILAIEAIARRNVNVLTVEISKSLAEPIKIQAQEIALNASMGITLLNEKESTAVSMMQQATTALLEARRLGGNGATIFSANLKDDRASELGLESDLRRAIGNDEIEVHYQPICYLNTMEIAGFEALARWRHPTQGLLPPLQFIDLAEKIGLINEIGQIVLTTAGRQLGIWQRVLRRDQFFFVSVNVSASHLLDKNFSKQLQDIINRETLSLGSLKIEVTESVIMRQPQKAAKLLRHLKSIGVGLSCDDFGTGFSSLSSLRDFPFDTLKIDKSFIALETYDERSAMIVTTITDLAHRLKMVVVGEGIETQDQIDNLATLGCDLGQGYLIGQAITATEVAAKLQVLQQKVIHEPPIEEEPSPVNDRPAVKNFQSLYAPIAPIQEELETDLLPSIFALPGMSGAEPKKRVRRQTPTKRAKKPTPAKKRKR